LAERNGADTVRGTAEANEGTRPMIVCALDEGQQSSAAAAYAVWLSESLALPLRLDDAETHDELIAGAASSDARLLVVGVRGTDSTQLKPVLSLVEAARTPVVVLPAVATAAWEDPHRARRTIRPTAVCGIDGSSIAADAAAIAGELATRLGGRLVIAHAVTDALPQRPASSAEPFDGVSDALHATERSELLDRTLAELRECPAEVCFRELYGEPVEVLDGVGSAESAALIAVGSRGVGRARLAFAGSIAAGLLRRATRPVLLMPPSVTGVAEAKRAELESTPVP
jgi:nucleotide-binding universal stress UspA family protein